MIVFVENPRICLIDPYEIYHSVRLDLIAKTATVYSV